MSARNKNSKRASKQQKPSAKQRADAKGKSSASIRGKVMPIRQTSGQSQYSMAERGEILAKFGDFKSYAKAKKELKGPSLGGTEVDEAPVQSDAPSVAKALFDPLAIYPFKITQTGQFSSSVGGSILSNTFWSPAGLGEYTSLSTLFSLVRIRRARVQLTSINPHSDGYAAGRVNGVLFCSCDYGLSGSNPSTTQAVIDCPNLLVMSLGSTRTHVLDTPNIDNEFAATGTPAPGPYAGCYGQFSYAASGLTVSTLYVQWTLECVYEFTSRT